MVTMEDADVEEYLPGYPQSAQVPEGASLSARNKLAWLQTVLYKKLFYPSGDKREAENLRTLSRFFHKIGNDIWGSVSGFDQYFKVELTQEVMEKILIVVNDYTYSIPIAEANKAYLQRFIRENPGSWIALLTFIHGSPSTSCAIKINAVHGSGFLSPTHASVSLT